MTVLDGGLSNALADRGHDLSDSLWTARLLRDAPDDAVVDEEGERRVGAGVVQKALGGVGGGDRDAERRDRPGEGRGLVGEGGPEELRGGDHSPNYNKRNRTFRAKVKDLT